MSAASASLLLSSLNPRTVSLFTPKPVSFFPLSTLKLHAKRTSTSTSSYFISPITASKALSSRFVSRVAVSSETDALCDEEMPSFSPDLKLFVGNLPFSVDSSQLADLFGNAGNVEMVEVIYDKETGRSRGFGFVTMSSVEEVEAAAQQFNGYELDGRQLRVNYGPPPPRRENSFRSPRNGASSGSGNRLHVGNLSWNVEDSDINTLFSESGKVLESRVVYDRESGRSRGFGFVTYNSTEEANNAVESLNGVDLNGRPIRVSVAEQKPRRF